MYSVLLHAFDFELHVFRKLTNLAVHSKAVRGADARDVSNGLVDGRVEVGEVLGRAGGVVGRVVPTIGMLDELEDEVAGSAEHTLVDDRTARLRDPLRKRAGRHLVAALRLRIGLAPAGLAQADVV